MRISTSGMHASALSAMLTQQATLSKTQNQIATGRRVQTPADDPVAGQPLLQQANRRFVPSQLKQCQGLEVQ